MSYLWYLSLFDPLIYYTVNECHPPSPVDPLNYWLPHCTPSTLFSMEVYLETWGTGMSGRTFHMQIHPPVSVVLPRGYVAQLQLTLSFFFIHHHFSNHFINSFVCKMRTNMWNAHQKLLEPDVNNSFLFVWPTFKKLKDAQFGKVEEKSKEILLFKKAKTNKCLTKLFRFSVS